MNLEEYLNFTDYQGKMQARKTPTNHLNTAKSSKQPAYGQL